MWISPFAFCALSGSVQFSCTFLACSFLSDLVAIFIFVASENFVALLAQVQQLPLPSSSSFSSASQQFVLVSVFVFVFDFFFLKVSPPACTRGRRIRVFIPL